MPRRIADVPVIMQMWGRLLGYGAGVLWPLDYP